MKILFFASLFLTLSGISQELSDTPTSPSYEVILDKCTLQLLSPSLKERHFEKLRLHNGLEVYLISDPDAEQSAAALVVEAGSWNDPKEYPGMAHFLEHMLFMGNKAYPQEFEYMQYVSDHGGIVNASTWALQTIYMFSINNNAFSGALDRFSHFFIDPLFSPSCINRELHAVDQEHAKNIENDDWRAYMIFKETGNPLHPNASFSTGNAQTLSGIPQEALKKWYEKNYRANSMHLAMVSPLSIDQMRDLTLQFFSDIPERSSNEETNRITEPMTSTEQLGHIIYIKPIKELKQLSLIWEISGDFARDLERKAPYLVAYALEAQGQKSLYELLKQENLIENIDISFSRYSKDTRLFQIDFSLTTQGVAQIDNVTSHVFEALARLKKEGIPEYLFEEKKEVALINYEYQSREEAFDFVRDQAFGMVYENLETYPEKTATFSLYDPKFTSAFINQLTPQKCLFVVMADPSLTGISPTTKEKWMDAEYAIVPIPQEKLTAWETISPNSLITLPSSNPFLPKDLGIHSHAQQQTLPELIISDATSQVYFSRDDTYLIPEAFLAFGYKSPLLDGTARARALSNLFVKALTEKLSSSLFFAAETGLHSSFHPHGFKLHFTIAGYNEKAPLLATEIFKAAKESKPSSEEFEQYKEWLAIAYDNRSKELPIVQGQELLYSSISNDSPISADKALALKEISYEDYLQFSADLFKTGFLEGFLFGNITQEESSDLILKIKQQLALSPYPPEQQHKSKVLLLPEATGPYLIQQKTERQGNAALLLLEEGSFSFEKRAIQQILGTALKEAFFDTLRTKQQTAYMAKAWELEEERELLQLFAVQSSTHHPRDLLARFELFIEEFLREIKTKISEERFTSMKAILIQTLEMPPENLLKMGERLNTLAFDYDADFSWYDKRIAAAKTITYEQFLQIASDFLSRKNAKRLAVLIEGQLTAENDFHYEEISREEIQKLGSYAGAAVR